MTSLQNFLLFAGYASFPLYLLPPGSIQIAHVLLVGALFFALLNPTIRFSGPAGILLALTLVALVRESAAILAGAPVSVLAQPAFVLFNLAAFVAVQTIYHQTRSVASYRWGLAVATAVALVPLLVTGVALTGDRIEQRAIGTFQSPNQLAYFAVIVFSTAALLYTFGRISGRLMAGLAACFFLLTFAAASKAGILGMFLGLIFLCIGVASGRVILLGAAAGVLLMLALGILDIDRLLFVQRLKDIGSDPDDGLAQRGYLVLLENARQPFQVWFGLGERGVREANEQEIHSTYLSFFGLYGIVGGLLYLSFLHAWVRTLYASLPLTRLLAIISPPLFYGIAHNGTRFTIFYVLAALSFSLCEERQPRSVRPRGRSSPEGVTAASLRRSIRSPATFRDVSRSFE